MTAWTKERTEALRFALGRATPDQWLATRGDGRFDRSPHKTYVLTADGVGNIAMAFEGNDPDDTGRSNAVLIATAHNDLPDLLAHVEALEQERDAARAEVARLERINEVEGRYFLKTIKYGGRLLAALIERLP